MLFRASIGSDLAVNQGRNGQEAIRRSEELSCPMVAFTSGAESVARHFQPRHRNWTAF